MGDYLNPGSDKFQESLASKIYVDKSLLISELNDSICTMQKFACVSRPRRFGKSVAMNMLAAYYGADEDTSAMFGKLKVSKSPSFAEHLNKYNVLQINIQEFLSKTHEIDAMIERMTKYVVRDVEGEYPGIDLFDKSDLVQVMKDVYSHTKRKFVILIDEWDCLFREFRDDKKSQERYLDFLRSWMKDQSYVALGYMTGILPVKKYGTHSALNMFTEYSMIEPRNLAEYFGFTEEEVKALCAEYDMPFEETQAWYDGYDLQFAEGRRNQRMVSIYSPKSVVDSMLTGNFRTYWNSTENYEALKMYVGMNYDGLKDAIVEMLAGANVKVNTTKFTNDMVTFSGCDDVLTLLVHLGYLSYDMVNCTVRIPNSEVRIEYINSIETLKWSEVVNAVNDSHRLLQALWDKDGTTVAEGVDKAHNEISILQYNDENSLCCCIQLAFYFAREYYNIFRELPTGKGFADIVFVPRKAHADKPACVIELKYDKDADGAIAQIKERKYAESLADYKGNIILAGINYDKETKTHSCLIEKQYCE